MVTKRKSEFAKARGDTRRGIGRMVAALPAWARVNWRDVVMPWRRLPAPVALALIALVALAMVLDTGDEANVSAEGQGVMVGGDTVAPMQCAANEVITYTNGDETLDAARLAGAPLGCVPFSILAVSFGEPVMVGGDTVAPGTRCEEDEVITYRVLMGGQGVGCVHYEYVVMEFIDTCLIGNTEVHPRVTPNLATLHLRDPEFGSWCASVVDDVSDGVVSLADMLVDVNMLPGYPGHVVAADAITPTITPTPMMGVSTTPTAALPKSLPSTGSR